MTQADRDRLVTLRKAKKRLITQRQAAEELGLSVRQVKRLVLALKKRGDKAVIHGLRGKASNQRIAKSVEEEAVQILSADLYRGFGPTLASEYLADRHDLIAMIDDATSRLFARFVRHDTTEENMRLLKSYIEKFGRPLAFYTDKAAIFQTAEKRKRDEPGVDKDPVYMPPTQIGRALQELGIVWIAAHSPQAKGRVERNFGTAQDRLVKGLRVAGVQTIEQANQYLEANYLVWRERELTVEPAHPDDAHRPLDKSHSLVASLSHVETRQVRNDYTIPLDAELYQIAPRAVVSGLRKASVRVEKRLDGSLAVRFGERYLPVSRCVPAAKPKTPPVKPAIPRRLPNRQRGREWGKNFDLKKGPKIWQVD